MDGLSQFLGILKACYEIVVASLYSFCPPALKEAALFLGNTTLTLHLSHYELQKCLFKTSQ